MKTLKKLGTAALALIVMLSFAACGKDEAPEKEGAEAPKTEVTDNKAPEKSPEKEEKPDEQTPAQKFVDEYGEAFEEELKEGSSDVEMEVSAEGNNVVIVAKTAQLDSLTEQEKKEYQQIYDMMKDSISELMLKEGEKMPGVDAIVYRICDSKGDVVASLDFDLK